MRNSIAGENDLVTLELLKEARILKRQLHLIKENIDQVSVENLIKICSITKVIEHEIDGFQNKSEVIISEAREKQK